MSAATELFNLSLYSDNIISTPEVHTVAMFLLSMVGNENMRKERTCKLTDIIISQASPGF
jgi:hypothetical protein